MVVSLDSSKEHPWRFQPAFRVRRSVQSQRHALRPARRGRHSAGCRAESGCEHPLLYVAHAPVPPLRLRSPRASSRPPNDPSAAARRSDRSAAAARSHATRAAPASRPSADRRFPRRCARRCSRSSTRASPPTSRGRASCAPRRIDLLTKFVAETPREAREMPEALVRLARAAVGERARVVRPALRGVGQAARRPARPRAGARLPRRPRPARRACSRTTPGSDQKTSRSTSTASSPSSRARRTRRAIASSASCATTRSRASCPTRTWPRPRPSSTGTTTTTAALAEYEKVLAYKGKIDPTLYGLALFKSAWCYWRLGNNDEAAKRFVGVFEATDTEGGGEERERRAAQAARRAAGGGAQVRRRGLHRGREEHGAGPLHRSSRRLAASASAARSCGASPSSTTTRRTTSAASRRTSCS